MYIVYLFYYLLRLWKIINLIHVHVGVAKKIKGMVINHFVRFMYALDLL